VDPPYESPAIFRALDKLSARMSDSGIVVCEHKRGLRMPEETGRLKLYRQYDYSKTQVSIYKIEELSE
ncbi:MAG TPA: RsmD family RNA methyltransferase, partial [Oscillospiraceae bacterium]|nr:RsmD family RNA methyltransferase [Oscillospiraceae bacterium]